MAKVIFFTKRDFGNNNKKHFSDGLLWFDQMCPQYQELDALKFHPI